jgi:hypothetical protein
VRTFPYRCALFAVALALDAVVCAAPAPAAIDIAIGDQRVVQNQPLSDCTTRAQNALRTLLQTPSQAGAGTELMAEAPVEAPATPPRAASIHCFPLDGSGYIVTFECAVEIPPNPTPASDLCAKLVAAFDASQSAYIDARTTGSTR